MSHNQWRVGSFFMSFFRNCLETSFWFTINYFKKLTWSGRDYIWYFFPVKTFWRTLRFDGPLPELIKFARIMKMKWCYNFTSQRLVSLTLQPTVIFLFRQNNTRFSKQQPIWRELRSRSFPVHSRTATMRGFPQSCQKLTVESNLYLIQATTELRWYSCRRFDFISSFG